MVCSRDFTYSSTFWSRFSTPSNIFCNPDEVKYVELGVKECLARAETVRNEVDARFNPATEGSTWFAAVILHISALYGVDFHNAVTYIVSLHVHG